MKFIRFTAGTGTEIFTGVLTDHAVKEIAGSIFGDWEYTGREFQESEIKLDSPILPRHILGIGKNFVPLGVPVPKAPELPIWFFKPTTTVVGPEAPIVLPGPNYEAKFESELAVVIGKEARNIHEQDALDYVLGYTIANDLADISYFHPEGHWTVGKAFDSFCPLGPYIETELDLEQVRIKACLNGQLMQNSGLELMIMSIRQQIAYLSTIMTLMPGDVILTGTPDGAAMLHDNDVIECVIEGLGVLRNQARKG